MAAATVPIEVFTFTKGKPMTYESSPGFVRLACGECGSALGMQAKNNPKLADFSLGCLDDPNIIRPNFHMHTDSQVDWCRVTDGGRLVPGDGRPATPSQGRTGAGQPLGRVRWLDST
jgi:hypothetical protein